MTGSSTLREGVERLQSEAGGILELAVIRPIDAVNLLGRVIMGDREAASLLDAVNQTLTRMRDAPASAPLVCVSCPNPIRDGRRCAFVAALPTGGNPASGLMVAVCPRCATEPAAIQAKAMKGLRGIWPDLRPITVTHAAGSRA